MMDCVAGYVNYALSLEAQQMNRESTMLSTNPPPDVFAHVCDYLTLAERITVTHVSHYWRELAVADARLWNRVVQHFADSSGARELLERSRNTPVHLELTVFDSNADAIAVYISEHLHHVKTLILRMSDGRSGQISQSAWTTVSYALARPAPVLETLYINMLRSAYRSSTDVVSALRPDFLAGDAPALRDVSLGGVVPPKNDLIEPFARATALTYAHHNSAPMTGADLAHLVANFPRIEELALSGQQFVDDGTQPARLRHLRVVDSTLGQGAESALRRLGYEDAALVCVRHNFHDNASMMPIVLDRTRAETLAATMSEVAVRARDEDNAAHERRFFGLGPDAIRSLLDTADVFRYLGSLLIHEFMWPQSGVLPPAPGLRELSVLLPTTAEHRNWALNNHHHPHMMGGMGANDEAQGMLTLFQLAPELPAPWNCASLRDFRLVFGGWSKTPTETEDTGKTRTVSTSDLLRFVETHLATALPLARIELKGVELLEAVHDVPAFRGLQANCSEFAVLPAGDDPTPQMTGLWDTYYARARTQERRQRR